MVAVASASSSGSESGSSRSGNRRGRGRRSRSNNGDRSTTANKSADSKDVAGTDDKNDAFYLPQIGVEIIASEERDGNQFHTICDLRNGHVIKNVTRKGARKLWNYAILQNEDHPVDPKKVDWKGNNGLISSEKRAGKIRYDLALRENGNIRVFYGVTEDGMEGKWAEFAQEE